MIPLLLFLSLSAASDSLPAAPPPRLAGSIALGWGLGGTLVQGDLGKGYGGLLRSFAEWHPSEAFALRASVRSQNAVLTSDRFRTHLVGGGLDGSLQWPSGSLRPRLSTGVTGALVSGNARPGTRSSTLREDWTLLVPVEVGTEWILGPQVSLHLWAEAQAFQLPADLLDGRIGSKGFRGRDELVSAGLAAAYRIDPVRDTDRDGVEDKRDRCVNAAEDRDGFQDDDGCPDLDNDEDGILDLRDRCPNLAEDRDGFQDGDGCPDPDNDNDGVPDAQDKCPLVAEDHDGFQDDDGCPDLDNDADGVPDNIDECPREAEDRDGFQDGDGCPDLDNDRDGVLDRLDKCPNSPETINGFQDTDGCPDISLKVSQSMIADRVWFKEGTDEFLEETAPALQEIADWLAGEPGARIEVRGYMDDLGSDRVNQILSQKRAEAVRQALVSRGVALDRVRSRGFGRLNPIASNRTPDGRARNRRIEIHRFE